MLWASLDVNDPLFTLACLRKVSQVVETQGLASDQGPVDNLAELHLVLLPGLLEQL